MIENLLKKQKELMEIVPHNVRKDSLEKMGIAVSVIDALLRYLNSTGHKPWRPNPLSDDIQQSILAEFKHHADRLIARHQLTLDKSTSPLIKKKVAGIAEDLAPFERQFISAFGVIEETVEYVNSLLEKDTEAHKLEELTDVLFFYLEQVLMSGFLWADIEAEYNRKWEVNIDRYRKAERGDYSWDNRSRSNL